MIHQEKVFFTEEQESILTRVESLLAAGLSRSRLSLETGIRRDHLDTMLQRGPINGFSPVDEHYKLAREALHHLEQWLEEASAAHQDTAARAETPSFGVINSILSIAHQNRSLVAITGAVGIGKTIAASHYAESHARMHKKPGAVRIQFNKTDNKPSAALAAILAGLHGENAGAYRSGNLFQAVGAKLRPGDFLILDECQRLETALDIVSSLHDDFPIGIAMLGNPDFSRAIWGKDRTFDALGSRVLRYDFSNNTAEDVEAWLSWKGILEGLSVKDRADLAKAAVSVGTRPGKEGGLRTLDLVIKQHASAYGKQPLTGPLLLHLVKQLRESE